MLKNLLLVLLLTIGVILRFYRFDSPVLDWHSFRQVDTLSVTRNVQNGTGSFFIPTYHDLSNLQSGLENPKGYRMVEIPIYNQLSVWASNFTKLPIEQSSRLVSIILSLLSAILIFKITKNIWSFAVFLLLPFNIFYNHTTLPENLAVFCLVATLFFLPKNIFFSSIFFAIGLLIKPYIAILLFPIYTYFFFKSKQKIIFIIFTLLSFLPFIIWRNHISNFPEGIPVYKWLFQQGFAGESFVVGRPYWFRWLFYERIGQLICGVTLIIPLLISLKDKINILYGLGIILYFAIMARGNVQHDYYQVLIIPFLAILIGYGLKKLNIILSIILLTISIFLSWQKVKEYYKINQPELIYAGWVSNNLLPKNALVIAPHTGDTGLLYQINRNGWPLEQYEIDKLKTSYNNPIYLVTVNNDKYANIMKEKYKSLVIEKDLIILDLQQTNP